MPPQQQIFRFDVAVDELLVVGVLQCSRGLLEIGGNGCRRAWLACGHSPTQGAVGRVIHDQIGGAVFNGKMADADDIGMFQSGNRARLVLELLQFVALDQLGMQQFDSDLGPQANIDAQVDLSKAPFA